MPTEVAVLMCAYNADRTIRQAVDSIRANTLANQLYVVDDCSRVAVADLVGPLPNVEVIRLERNQGLAAALNIGVQHILQRRYKYIARMDADDVAYPDRLAKQLAFLESHPQVGIVGSAARYFDDETGRTVMNCRQPLTDAGIRNKLFFNSALVHPTWLARAEVFASNGPYSGDYPAAEDYEFVRRLAGRIALANLPDCLLDYRVSATGISVSKRRRQLFDRLRVQLRYYDPLEWRAWVGIMLTLILFVVPMRLLAFSKADWPLTAYLRSLMPGASAASKS